MKLHRPISLPALAAALPIQNTARPLLIADEELDAVLKDRKAPKAKLATVPENGCPQWLNLSTTGKRAVLSIYDEISWWSGNDAATFRQTLKALDVDVIEVRINSPGGSVFEGVAIYNMLVAHPAAIEVHIDGLAASIASVIALAGEERHTAENALWMIHNPSLDLRRAEAKDLRKMADVLDKVKDSILNTYVTATGLDRAELSLLMDETTYLTADEAMEKGFSTHLTKPIAAAALWDPENYDLPETARALGKPPKAPTAPGEKTDPPPPPAPPATQGTVEDVAAARERIEALRKLHGL